MNGMADQAVARHLGRPGGRLWPILLGYNEAFVLRPVRLLDAAEYALPPADYLRRRYGRSGAGPAAAHFLRALGQYGRGLADAVYYTWDYHHRLKAEDRARGFR
jgi:hypothetical protein